MQVIPIILCGGSGTRLWPLSRELYPKQLLSLIDDRTLLQNTISRCKEHPDISGAILVCNEDHRFLVAEQLREMDIQDVDILLEPEGRNTAPAVALAAHLALQRFNDAILVVLPSDHVIQDKEGFIGGLSQSITLAKEDHLVTFGVVPTRAESGYGYIRRGTAQGAGYVVDEFVEKPDTNRAKKFLSTGKYYWNSGMFVFKASVYLNELNQRRPDIAESCTYAASEFNYDLDFIRVNGDVFRSSPSESIDCAVMEQSDNALVVPLDVGWSDIGSWDALWEVLDKDANNNAITGDVIANDMRNSLIRAEHRLVSAIGLDKIVIVETADAVMVTSMDRAQEIKFIVSELKSADRNESALHRRVLRPWGYYESLDNGTNFQVKRIAVNPGASLSLQLHHGRAEHWIVVAGTATVTRDEETFDLLKNESTFIPIKTKHRLQNLTEEILEIIEVQSGDYLSEEDIVRFEDLYGRDN